MEHHLDEKSLAPPATLTITKDAKEEQVATLPTPAEVWRAIHAMFAAQSQAQAINTRIELTNLQKCNTTMAKYLGKIRSLTDEVACTAAALSDPEIVSKILAGLDMDYNPVVSALAARVEPVTVQELYSQLLSFDARLSLLHGANIHQSSANSASRGRGGGRGHQGQHSSGRGRVNNDGGYNNNSGSSGYNNTGGSSGYNNTSGSSGYNYRAGGGGFNNNNNNNNRRASSSRARPRCQLCKKAGHEVMDCWHRYDENYVPDARHVAAAMREQGGEGVWYVDSSATDHVTSELEQLALREQYHGNDQIHTTSGGGLGHHFMCAGKDKNDTESAADLPGRGARSCADPRARPALAVERSELDRHAANQVDASVDPAGPETDVADSPHLVDPASPRAG
nr:myb-like protein P [Aegilops tauschii subsp. strangulata]